MDTMISVWTIVENVRVSSGAAELVLFTALLYWFFTSSRVADMLEVVGERVGGWCGRESSGSLRQAVRAHRRQFQADVFTKINADVTTRNGSLYRIKEGPVVPNPEPQTRPATGLACARCAALSRSSWHDPKETDSVINILDIGRQSYANGGVVSRYLCDLVHCCNLPYYQYNDVVPYVEKDDIFQKAIEDKTQDEMKKCQNNGAGDSQAPQYETVRKRVEQHAGKVLLDISSAMSNNVLKFVAWVCHKAIRRIAGGGCSTRVVSTSRLRRAAAAGAPLVFVPLHRSHFDYVLVTFCLYLMGLRPPLVAAGDNMRIPFFGWFLRGCGAFYIKRRVDGAEHNTDTTYKAALKSYILNSLSSKNNLEFYIEGGRTRTGKPQLPKAGILSVIMEAYLDGTIDDALLVPVTLNYDKLVDGNFVREQLGMSKQMETFWSALRGIWRTLNTNHGSIRVDFNQPISLKELVMSFQKYNHYKAPLEMPLSPPNNNLAQNLDRQILYNHSHSSLYGDDVTADHKMMVEAIGRHLVYDAAQATAVMCTNVLAYVLLTEERRGCTTQQLLQRFTVRGEELKDEQRDLGYTGDSSACLNHALDMLGRGLVSRGGSKHTIRPQLSIPAALELSYYANTLTTHYAAPAIVATALESILCEAGGDRDTVSHDALMHAALQLCAVLSGEFVLSAPCTSSEERLLQALDALIVKGVLVKPNTNVGLEEEQWSRRFARRLEEEMDGEVERDMSRVKYTVSQKPEALAERRRLILTIRPLLEAYAASCRCVASASQKQLVKDTLDHLTTAYTHNKMMFGEAVSTDAIRNCHRLLRQWGVIEMYTENRLRHIRICDQYDNQQALYDVCTNIYKFNMDTPLLSEQ